MSVSSEIAPYLLPDETILKKWSTRDRNIYATQHRIFLISKDFLSTKVEEASYDHISSIEFASERSFGRLVAAILFLVLRWDGFEYLIIHLFELFGLPLTFEINIIFLVTFLLLGIGFLMWFIFGIDEFFMLHVVGRKPIIVLKELSDMVRFVREKKSL